MATTASSQPQRAFRPIYMGGYKEGNKIAFDDAFTFSTLLRERPDGRVLVRVGPPKRSDEANAYYWLVLGLIEEHTGHSADDLHEYFKQRFIPKRLALSDDNGEVKDDVVIGGSTAKMSRQDFYDYVEAVRHFALVELHIETPDPDPKLARRNQRSA